MPRASGFGGLAFGGGLGAGAVTDTAETGGGGTMYHMLMRAKGGAANGKEAPSGVVPDPGEGGDVVPSLLSRYEVVFTPAQLKGIDIKDPSHLRPDQIKAIHQAHGRLPKPTRRHGGGGFRHHHGGRGIGGGGFGGGGSSTSSGSTFGGSTTVGDAGGGAPGHMLMRGEGGEVVERGKGGVVDDEGAQQHRLEDDPENFLHDYSCGGVVGCEEEYADGGMVDPNAPMPEDLFDEAVHRRGGGAMFAGEAAAGGGGMGRFAMRGKGGTVDPKTTMLEVEPNLAKDLIQFYGEGGLVKPYSTGGVVGMKKSYRKGGVVDDEDEYSKALA
jgi:hypothetical protein